jgi:homoserine acetyltransferase
MPPLLMRTLVSIVLLLADAGFALAHWPGQPNHRMAYLGDFALERGGIINDLKISYVTHGTPFCSCIRSAAIITSSIT